MKTYSINLTYEELKHLDGLVSEKAQKVIDKAKSEVGFGLDERSNEILADSLKTGTLKWCSVKISECICCKDKPRGYHTYARTSRYHYKGDKNYDKPLRYFGVQPNPGFVIMDGLSGICTDCWKQVYLPKLATYIVENNLPIEIQKNDFVASKFKKDPIRICGKCHERMRESEMGRTRTLFGDGTFPSTCPKCGASSGFGNGVSHETTDDFVMIPIDKENNNETN